MDIREKFLRAIAEKEERKGIHVTSLIYSCLRRGFYTQIYGHGFFSQKSLLRFWYGKAIHDKPILAQHELELEYNGIIGRIDDYEDGTLLEKKTIKSIPVRPYPHHETQVNYYAVLLVKNGYAVNKAYLLYLKLTNPEYRFFEIKLKPIDEVEKEMVAKKTILQNCIEREILPPNTVSEEERYLCDNCAFSFLCANNLIRVK